MNRNLLTLLAAAGLAPLGAAAGVISLDRPGALEAIAAENPAHHQRLQGILKASQEMPCERDQLQRLSVAYDAREARCSTMLLASLPSKRRLSFTLDGQDYVATVEMSERSRQVKVPAR